jgi:hypothetical protein
VYVVDSAAFDMNAGFVSDNKVTAATGYGGGVCVIDTGVLNMEAGSAVSGNLVNGNDGNGGGVYVGIISTGPKKGTPTFNMLGGTISGNGIGSVSVTGGTGKGAGVYVDSLARLVKTGGTIYGVIKASTGAEDEFLQNYYKQKYAGANYPTDTATAIAGGKRRGYAVFFQYNNPPTGQVGRWRDQTINTFTPLTTDSARQAMPADGKAGWNVPYPNEIPKSSPKPGGSSAGASRIVKSVDGRTGQPAASRSAAAAVAPDVNGSAKKKSKALAE